MFFAISISVTAQTKTGSGECTFDSYHPIYIGNLMVGGHDRLAIEKVAPIYPSEAQRKGIEGRVAVQVLVNQAGEVVKACGVGNRMLTIAAEQAVAKWKFQKNFGLTFPTKAPSRSGFAVLRLTFDFRLTNDTPELKNSK